MEGRQLLREIAELEKELKVTEEQSAKDSLNNRAVIVSHPELSYSKNVDNVMWKHCFYRNIEYYRKRIRAVSTTLEKASNGDISIAPHQLEDHRTMLLRLNASFGRYTSEVSDFYGNLLIQLEEMLKSTFVDQNQEEGAPQRGVENDETACIKRAGYVRSIHFCLLFLGDVARYAELHNNDRKTKVWKAARGYYLRARQILPTIGNPCNQLAVLSSYEAGPNGLNSSETELNAIYFYCRSILVAQPFQTGIDNLKVVFDKSARNSSRMAAARGNSSGASLQRFFSRFISLHGLLFGLAQKEGAVRAAVQHSGAEPALTPHTTATPHDEFQYSIGSTPPTPEAIAATLSYSNTMTKVAPQIISLMPNVVDELESFLSNAQSGLTSEHLLRLMTICLFSVHCSTCESVAKSPSTSPPQSPSPTRANAATRDVKISAASLERRTNSQSLALIFLFNVINKLSLKVCPLGSTDKPRRGIVLRVLQAFSVFSDWGRENAIFLHSCSGSAGVSDKPSYTGDSVISASPDLLRSENRARSSMRVTFADMSVAVGKLFKETGSSSNSPSKTISAPSSLEKKPSSDEEIMSPLSEHIELRGYLPLAKAYELFFQTTSVVSLLAGPLKPAVESQATLRRVHNLEDFVNHALAPPPPPTPVEPPVILKPRRDRTSRSDRKDRDRTRKSKEGTSSLRNNDKKKSKRRSKDDTSSAWEASKKASRPREHRNRRDTDHPSDIVREGGAVSGGPASKIYQAALEAARGQNEIADITFADQLYESSRRRKENVPGTGGEDCESGEENDEQYEESSAEESSGYDDDDSSEEVEEEEGDGGDGGNMSEGEGEGGHTETVSGECDMVEGPGDRGARAAVCHGNDEDSDEDEIIVFKPAFARTSEPVSNGFHSRFDDKANDDALDFLSALHDKNTSLNGWGIEEAPNVEGLEFDGIFGKPLPSGDSDMGDTQFGWNLKVSSAVAEDAPPPGFSAVPPGFHGDGNPPAKNVQQSRMSSLPAWMHGGAYDDGSSPLLDRLGMNGNAG